MSRLNPIYTEIRECADCNKCIRECPVKSIKVKEGHAFIDPDLCILCGHCTIVCPMGAKKVRNDLERVKDLISSGKKVIASVAPSYLSEFPELSIEKLKDLFLKLGFYDLEETALGAQMVSRHVNSLLQDGGCYLSSCCPVTVGYIKKYRPEISQFICNLDSPLLAHGKDIKRRFSEDYEVVFFGPCIAKKVEADSYPDIIHTSLTFKDLRKWVDDESISINDLVSVPLNKKGLNGNLYPIEGGMIRSLCQEDSAPAISFSYSGMKSIINGLDGLNKIYPDNSRVFFELLACDGGCINGPGASCNSMTALKTVNVLSRAEAGREKNPKTLNITNNWPIEPVSIDKYTEDEVSQVMKGIGKITKEDEINCGACGYSTCREFSIAILSGKAETNMCLSYLRKLSERKANTLINTMPSGVIMADSSLKIVESNNSFAKLMGSDWETIYSVNDGLEGVPLSKILPNYKGFKKCLETGESLESIIKVNGKIIKVIVYSVVDYLVVGGIFRDVTEPRIQRERIISKAQDVLKKNVATVQQIAYLLGESAAESEVMLNSIIESFGQEEGDGV